MKVILGSFATSMQPEYGGAVWVRLQYMLGLRRLGIEPYWVDRVPAWNALERRRSLDYNLEQFARLADDFGFRDRYCVVVDGGAATYGMDAGQYDALTREAAALVNISGYLPEGSPLLRVPKRAYIDVDPGFTQIWARSYDMNTARHNYFFTVGVNVGTPRCRVPAALPWTVLYPPVVLEEWPPFIDERCACFTTVAGWRGSQHASFEGEAYTGKRSQFLRVLSLPLKTGQVFELALNIGPAHADIKALCEHDWRLVDPYRQAGDVKRYREYLRYSRAEFSVAKQGYVKSNSGWVSDRTVCYLASGKPALVQSTGFEDHLPTGEGLLTFRTLDDAVAGVETINADYLAHCRAARALAEAHFDSDRVLAGLLDRMDL